MPQLIPPPIVVSAPYVSEKIMKGRPCEVQEVSTRGATGGTFTLTYGGQETVAILWNATSDTFQAALEVGFAMGLGNRSEVRTANGIRSRFDFSSRLLHH